MVRVLLICRSEDCIGSAIWSPISVASDGMRKSRYAFMHIVCKVGEEYEVVGAQAERFHTI